MFPFRTSFFTSALNPRTEQAKPPLRLQRRSFSTEKHHTPTEDMQLFRPFMGSLAISAIILSFTVFETVTGEKPLDCCTRVSTKYITVPITGFRFQRKNPPCVTAVIFETTEGPVCSHWQEKWVQESIRNIRQKQNLKSTTKSVVPSTVPPVTNGTAATEYLSSPVTATSATSFTNGTAATEYLSSHVTATSATS